MLTDLREKKVKAVFGVLCFWIISNKVGGGGDRAGTQHVSRFQME